MARPALLACDWGTTNLRAWTLDEEGAVLAERFFPMGVSTLQPGTAAARFEQEVRPALDAEGLPAMLCGMVGSNIGLAVAPYAECPADLAMLAANLLAVAPSVHIVPGLKGMGLTGAPDVMRGEETQLLGWMAADRARAQGRHLVCHPGTHAKWAMLEDGRILRFATAMTGELFALLTRHSIVKSDAPATDEAAFHAGLEAAGDGGALAARLFSARARVVVGAATADTTPSYLSGLLIGAEVAAMPRLMGWEDAPIILLGDGALCARYQAALAGRGMTSEVFDGGAAAVAGLFALHRMAFHDA